MKFCATLPSIPANPTEPLSLSVIFPLAVWRWVQLCRRPIPNEMEVQDMGPGKGRGLVATRSYRTGEVLLCEEPLAAALLPDRAATRCDWSFVSKRKLLRCGQCKVMRFASRESQKLAWRAHYKFESAALLALSGSGLGRVTPPALVRLTARILWGETGEAAVLLEHLEGHWEARDAVAQAKFLRLAALTRELLRAAAAGEEAEGVVDLPLLSIAQLMSRLACNVHTICSEEQEPLGLGIYCGRAHLFNHARRASCVQSFELDEARRPALLIRAARAIRVGDELTISYVDACEPCALQRLRLLRGWFFDPGAESGVAPSAGLRVLLRDMPADELHVCRHPPAGFSCDDVADCALNAIVLGGAEGAGGVGLAGGAGTLFCLARSCDNETASEDPGVRVDLFGAAIAGGTGDATVVALARRAAPFARRVADVVRQLVLAESGLDSAPVAIFDLDASASAARHPRDAAQAAVAASSALSLLADDVGGNGIVLGPCHWLRVRAWQAVLDAALQSPASQGSAGEVTDDDELAPGDAQRWGAALSAARALLPVYDLVYSGPSPALALHLFKLAKLELLLYGAAGGCCRAALRAAERASDLVPKFAGANSPLLAQLRRLQAEAQAGAARGLMPQQT